MDTPLKIEEFNTLLNSEQDTSPLMTALVKLTAIEQPAVVVEASVGPQGNWFGWS
jgi:hypothetical protein